MNYGNLDFNILDRNLPIPKFCNMPKDEQVGGFAFLAYQLIREKRKLKPCDPIPENVVVFTKTHLKKFIKLKLLDKSNVGMYLDMFDSENSSHKLFMGGVFCKAVRAIKECKGTLQSVSTVALQSDSMIKINFSGNIKPPLMVELLSVPTIELINLIAKDYQEISDWEIKNPENKTCQNCVNPCEKFLRYFDNSVIKEEKNKPVAIITKKSANVESVTASEIFPLSVSDIVKKYRDQINKQPSKTLKVAKLLKHILDHNDGCIPSLIDFAQGAKDLGIEEMAYKYREYLKRSIDFNVINNKFNVDHSTEAIKTWFTNERKRIEKERILRDQKMQELQSKNSNSSEDMEEFIREIEKRMKKIEIEYLELQSFIHTAKKTLKVGV